MEIDLDKLEATARAAADAQDPWYYPNSHLGDIRQQDKDYIAAADPDVVLALVSQVAAARALLVEVLDMNEDDALVNFAGRPSSRFDDVADRIQTLLDGGAE
jgi:hypothetical protein